MPSQPLTRLVRRLRQSLDADTLATAADAELLAHFRRHRDPAAFEALVRRHGPRVLAAARRVLADPADIDDAVQATFLVLMRNPGAVRDGRTLGGWLVGVAHRVSLKAVARHRRREQVEARAEPLPPATTDLSWREACAILHEELDRLPDRHRLPLLLCYLEGLSRDEAAARLGRSVNQVKRALEVGRVALRERLTRRGVALSAGLLAAVTSPAPAELPAGTVDHCARVVLAGSAPAAARALARSVARPVVPVRVLLALCVAAVVVGFGMSFGTSPPPTDPPAKDPPPPPIVQARPPPAVDAPPPARTPEPPPPPAKPAEPVPDVFTYRGRAVTLDGKPVKDAEVFLHVISLRPKPFVPRARTDADGRFAFEVKRSEIDPAGYELSATPWANGHLIASAPGLGVAWTRDLAPGRDAELLFVPDDVPVEGRVLNLEGKPVAGARVRTVWVLHPAGGNLDRWLEGLKGVQGLNDTWKALHGLEGVSHTDIFPLHPLRRNSFDPAVRTVTSGPDGRFTVRGIGRDRVALLHVEEDGIESRPTVVVTRRMDAIVIASFTLDQIGGSMRGRFGTPTDTVYGARFDLAVGPDRPVVGVVTDRDTGKPVAGAVVTSGSDAYGIWDRHRARATTGLDGRFRLTGLPMRDDCRLEIRPPADQPYFPINVTIRTQPGLGPIELNPKLKRGIWLTGKVFDRDTRAGVRARFEYGAVLDNPHLPPRGELTYEVFQFSRPNDGTFRTPVLPGQSYFALIVEGPEGKRYERGQGTSPDRMDEIIFTDPASFSGSSVHSVTRLNVPADATEVKLDFPLTPGRSAKVAVRGPEGEPLRGVVVTADPDGPRSEKLGSDGTLMVRPRQFVQAVCPDRRLAGRLRLTGTESGPVTLTLQPWAEVTGRIVTADGKPVPDAVLSFAGDAAGDEPAGFWYQAEPVRTDANGVYRIAGLVPGAAYRVLVWAKGRPGQELRFRAGEKPGAVQDVGELRPER